MHAALSFNHKPPKGTVPLGGFAFEIKSIKCSIYAAFDYILPTRGTVPFVVGIANYRFLLSFFAK